MYNFFFQAWIQTTTTFALANLEKFTKILLVKNRGNVIKKSGKHWIKFPGKPGNFEDVNFFPVSAPVFILAEARIYN